MNGEKCKSKENEATRKGGKRFIKSGSKVYEKKVRMTYSGDSYSNNKGRNS